MFSAIVVGTDGSDTATEAVRQAIALAKPLGASLQIVSAYEPVSDTRLREEAQQAPQDLQWMVNPREDAERRLREQFPGLDLGPILDDAFGAGA